MPFICPAKNRPETNFDSREDLNCAGGKKSYSADSIQALEGIEHVRKRPSMYIGDLSTRGLHHLVYEVVDNSIDEAMAGHCSEISIQINTDKSISIEDNGRGIPVGIHKKEGVSALEVVMTKIGAGGKFDKDSYKVSGGLHGVGVSVVNALSEVLTANVYRDGKEYQQIYKKGKPDSKVKEIGKSDKKGTLVTFKPDKDIFKEVIDFEYDILSNRMRELSFLNKGITISITDNREETKKGEKKSEIFHSKRKLKNNPIYNIKLGSYYLTGLLENYEGSYPFALASYNAGPKRVKYWKKINGNPQKGKIDYVNWIELIKFDETRNYIQRVLENVNVYRYILSNKPVKIYNFFEDKPHY